MKGKQRRQESIGNDLPHMPAVPASLPPARASIPLPTPSTASGRLRFAQDSATLAGSTSSSSRQKVPPGAYDYDYDHDSASHLRLQAADVENATLVSREVSRLRNLQSQKKKRRRKIWAGAADLLLMALTTYVLARYIMAYMHLSPGDVPLSKSTQDHVSADPLLRTIALLSVCLTAYSDLLFLFAAIYLRFSRKRSWCTPVVYVGVILAAVLQIVLCLSNLGIVLAWHSYYQRFPDNVRGTTRDVARRCNGQWEFDLVWDAASASPIADPSDGQDSAGNTAGRGCPTNNKTYHLFIMAAVVRIAIFVACSVLFLHLLRKYNQSLHLGLATVVDEHQRRVTTATAAVNDDEDDVDEKTSRDATPTVKESAEMHQLLTGSSFIAGLPPPRLDRFGWQRGEPSTHEPDQMYQNVQPHHRRENSSGAEGWGAALYRRFWNASSSNADGGSGARHHQVPLDEQEEDDEWDHLREHHAAEDYDIDHDMWYSPALESRAELAAVSARQAQAQPDHGRDSSKIGVSGWFEREASGEDDVVAQQAHTQTRLQRQTSSTLSTSSSRHHVDGSSGLRRPLPVPQPSSSSPSLHQHQRTPSQERRAAEARHQASKKSSGARPASSGGGGGDSLPHMPSPASSEAPLTVRNDPTPSNASRHPPRQASSPTAANAGPMTPSYVRHLGRMVQRMPSITSGDGQSGTWSRGPSESSQQVAADASGQHVAGASGYRRGSSLGEVIEQNGRGTPSPSPFPGAWS